MGLNDMSAGIREPLKAAIVIASILVALPAAAQEKTAPPDKQTEQQLSKEELERLKTYQQIPLPDRYFKIDEVITKEEGTPEKRREMAQKLFGMVTKDFDKDDHGIKEKVFPLKIDGEMLGIRVMIIPGGGLELKIIVFNPLGPPDGDSIQLIDVGVTGNITWNQLPAEEKGFRRPQGFALGGTNRTANRLYYGILQHLTADR